MTNRQATIRELNDKFRYGDTSINGQLLVTSGVNELINKSSDHDIGGLLNAVKAFDDFDADNDPYGEHDFGAFDFLGERLFWKIDYYGLDMQIGAENPADNVSTVRVLTIMLASEY